MYVMYSVIEKLTVTGTSDQYEVYRSIGHCKGQTVDICPIALEGELEEDGTVIGTLDLRKNNRTLHMRHECL